MLYTLAVLLLALWVAGLVTNVTVGGFIHTLPVVAIVMIVVNFMARRKRLI